MESIYTCKELVSQKINFIQQTNQNKELTWIYKPNDDSYMILYTILKDIDRSIKGKIIIEIGIGSGFVLQNLKNNLEF